MSDDRLDRLERRLTALEDERDIARLIASYGPLVDSGEAERVAALWAVDGVYDVEDWLMTGRDEVARWCAPTRTRD
jgi:SnoaL-like domain